MTTTTSTPPTAMSVWNWFQLGLLSLLWGASFFFAKVALEEIGPLTLVMARVGIAALALGIFLRPQLEAFPTEPALWRSFAALGLLNNLVPFSLLFWGQTHIGGGLAAVLTATTPAFTVVVAHWTTDDERLTPAKAFGIALGVFGVAVLFGVELSGGLLWLLAMAACLGASMSYAAAAVYGRRFKRQDIDPTTVAFGQVTSTAILMTPIALALERPWQLETLSVGPVVSTVALGLLSTALAYAVFFRLLASAGATNATLVTLLIPITALALGYLFLDERLSPTHAVGIGLILIGLLAIDGRLNPVWRGLVRVLTHPQ